MKYIFSKIIFTVLFLTFIPLVSGIVYAQEATNSAAISVASSSAFFESEASSSGVGDSHLPDSARLLDRLVGELIPNSLDQLNDVSAASDSALTTLTNQSLFSARLKQPIKVYKLAKKHYRASEKVTVTINHITSADVNVVILDPLGNEEKAEIQKITEGEEVTLHISPSPEFRPGKHKVKILSSHGNTISEQEFTWGVLAINTNKSIYLPNETSKMAIAVLDEYGEMVCNAKVQLIITNPDTEQITLSTEDQSIKVNPQCYSKDFSLEPDYETSYQVKRSGRYDMILSAETSNGVYTISDTFEVRDEVVFEVERQTATRIYPPKNYPVNFTVKASKDFRGTVAEFVPESFQIQNLEGVQQFDFVRIIDSSPSRSRTFTASDLHLLLPFKDDHHLSQGFGSEETDPLLAQKYKEAGVEAHDGLDFAMPIGTPIYAVDDGEVVRARDGDYGFTVVINHSWGKSYYGHLSKFNVAEGDKIEKGMKIAESGNTGLSTGPHLHFGMKLNEHDFYNGYFGKVDPLPFLNLNNMSNVAGVSTIQSSSKVKVITWNIDVKKGETINLGYKFLAPPESPEFYTLGPLTFTQEESIIFQETRLWQIASDAVANGGTIVYGDSVDTGNLNFRTHTDPTSVGGELTTVATDANTVTFVKVAASPTREEKIAVHLKATGRMDVLTCTSGCDAAVDWTLRGTYSTTTTDANAENMRAFDVAYEQLSGDAIVVFTDDNTVGTAYYCIWNGSSWSPPSTCGASFTPGAANAIDLSAVTVGGQPEWVRLVPRGDRLTSYRTDEMLLAISDSADDLYLGHWTGSAWDLAANPVDDLTATDAQKFDIAWEETTGEGLAIVTNTAVANLRFATYESGTGWSAISATGPANNGGQAYNGWIEMASDPGSDDISIITADAGADAELFIWNGSSIVEGTDDVTAEAMTGKAIATAWTRTSGRAVFLWTDTSALTSDMECWTSAGGFTAIVGDTGNPNISSTDDVEDRVLVASPNNNRMIELRRDIEAVAGTGDDLEGLVYSDSTGCADGDWSNTSTATLNSDVEGGTLSNTVRLSYGGAYTPYSPWSRNWRFYDDETSNNPSVGLNGASENRTATGVNWGETFRLRMQFIELSNQAATDERKKLQYTSGCTPNSTGGEALCTWSDVMDTTVSTGAFRYATAAESCGSCSDNTALTGTGLTGSTQFGTYISDFDAASGTNMDHNALATVEYDYPLVATTVTPGTTYYFRAVSVSTTTDITAIFRRQDTNGTTDCLSARCTYPSLTITPDPTTDQQMRHGKFFYYGEEKAFTF